VHFWYDAAMRHYPAFLNLHGRRCLVVGAGEVGLRKVKTLASCHPAEITVIDTAPPSEAMIPLLDDPAVVYNQRPFSDDDIMGRTLVFACTSNAELNARVARLCNAGISASVLPAATRRSSAWTSVLCIDAPQASGAEPLLHGIA
jgi:precorrin-2 dehydrogenase/sirohydrochlorin ferrochelatase